MTNNGDKRKKERVWFITGTSKGFGREFVRAALERGDKVAATARDITTLAQLTDRFGDKVLPLTVDVRNRVQVFEAISTTKERFGRIDVVINNAGYALFGAIDEITEQQLRDQFETNLFGVFHVTQAALPIMREQRSGHIIQVSSTAGVVASPGLGGYNASKWALEGMTDALAQEVAGFGIKVTLIEPGGFATDWRKSATFGKFNPTYDAMRAARAERSAGVEQPKPAGFGDSILELVDTEQPPLRVFFGEGLAHIVSLEYQQRLQTWAEWESLSRKAEGKEVVSA